MFTKIKISNIKGIYGTITYDLMSPAKKKDKKDTIKQIDKYTSVNKICATIGSNAVGKSSIIDAINFAILFLRQTEIIEDFNKITDEIDENKKNRLKELLNLRLPYVRNKDRIEENSEMSFEIYIPEGDKPGLYEYTLVFSEEYIHEKLDYKKSINSRKTKNIDEYESNNLRSNIGYKYTFKDSIIQDYEQVDYKLVASFKEKISYIITFYEYINRKVCTISTSSMVRDIQLIDFLEENKSLFKEFINIIDSKIFDFKIKKNKDKKIKEVFFILKDGTEIDFVDISTGTRRMIKLFERMYDVLKNNGIIVCDEIEVSLHRELVQFIIKLFLNNNNYSQLIFTTHDPYVFSFNNIRNSQINFLKYENGQSELINIGEINPRSDYSISKNYYENSIFMPRPDIETIDKFCNKYIK